MAEYITPGIKKHYYYQNNALLCWAAVGLTLWRSKYGAQGRGANIASLVKAPGGEQYTKMLDYAGELSIEMMGSWDLSTLQAAETAVRRREPKYATTPSGLPDTMADGFFTYLGCKSTTIDASLDGEAMKALVKDKGPIAIFKKKPGHLMLIVGTWDADPPSAAGPQIIIFDPETYIVQMEKTSNPDLDPKTIKESRWLWAHWKQYFASNLVGNKGWHY